MRRPCSGDQGFEPASVRVIDAFVDTLKLAELGGSKGSSRRRLGGTGYHPSALLKLYVYGYLNRVQALLVQRGGDCSGQARDVNGAEASGAALAPVVG